MSLQQNLDRIAQLQGKIVPRGDRIEGFGPDHPPAPAYIPVPSAREQYGDPIEPFDDPDDVPDSAPESIQPPAFQPSPLIPRGSRLPVAETRAPLASASPFAGLSLVVADGFARLDGRDVILTDDEVSRLKYGVLRALLRAKRQEQAEIEEQLPKRRRRAAKGRGPVPAAAEPDGKIPSAIPKKRGRPRKVTT